MVLLGSTLLWERWARALQSFQTDSVALVVAAQEQLPSRCFEELQKAGCLPLALQVDETTTHGPLNTPRQSAALLLVSV